jgi:hypothetical protein
MRLAEPIIIEVGDENRGFSILFFLPYKRKEELFQVTNNTQTSAPILKAVAGPVAEHQRDLL